MLGVIDTHPIQYRAPLYRFVQSRLRIPVTAVYASDFSVVGYHDDQFDTTFRWDTDLLSGYSSIFLSRVAEGGARELTEVSSRGLNAALRKVSPKAVLLCGYSPRFHQAAFFKVWRAGYPILFRGETIDIQRVDEGWKDKLRRAGLNEIYKRCKRLLYIGERSRRHYLELGCDESKLVFAPYSID